MYARGAPFVLTKLVRNYRNHPDILSLPNRLFYGNDLVPCADRGVSHSLAHWQHLPNKGVPLIFDGFEGDNQRESNSPSWFNAGEASRVVDYVLKLVRDTKAAAPHDIGVISPYVKQVQKIRELLRHEGAKAPGLGLQAIKVASTELFQGQERRVIIISTVRSSSDFIDFDLEHNLGFLVNPKRFNVAITRAQALLIVVGNPKVLAADEHWRALIERCSALGAYVGVPLQGGGEAGVGTAGNTPGEPAAVPSLDALCEHFATMAL